MKIAILTSKKQWFVSYARELVVSLQDAKLFFDHRDMDDEFDIVFILGYHTIIPKKYLEPHTHNVVIHESALPQGKGWAPMFWQILEGKNEIPFTMFEASFGVDNGDIYMQKTLKLNGFELNSELRDKQARFTIHMCLEFISNYDKYKIPTPQEGDESYYQRRGKKDSQLDTEKSIDEQFNLLRIVDNENYPAFFEIAGTRYILKIEKVENENR